MRLYEYAEDFARLFDDLDAIADYVPDQNDDGIITADAAREAVCRYKRSMGVRSVRVCE